MNDIVNTAVVKRAGLFETTVQKLFTRSAHVLEIVDFGSTFRLVTLGGDALRDVDWTPGDKIQIQLGGWVQRTYTPIDWDSVHGRTRILVCLHAPGPGTAWARRLQTGDPCVVFGPRKSIQAGRSTIVVGDETSVGLAAALSGQALLEVAALADTQPVIDYLGLHAVQLTARLDTDRHFGELETRVAALLMIDATVEIVLTGRASTIQHMTRFLKQTEMGSGRRHSKAYWASGKTGLD
ncbi:MAG: siderophore-interacting protein [Pseudomonadota bacterium]|nr:siderophore-interacting protein [Pseudomonadota bacterium]